VVIVDEAGQITTPAVLPALLRGRSFVLVGDHYQLPPLVLDPRAQAGGLGISLFRQLCEAHPNAVVKLQQQYRMAGGYLEITQQQLLVASCSTDAVNASGVPGAVDSCMLPWVLQVPRAFSGGAVDTANAAADTADCALREWVTHVGCAQPPEASGGLPASAVP
jgi:hypothetical protein